MNKVNKILSSSRTWAEEYAKNEGLSSDLTGVCAIASSHVSDEFHKAGIPHKICMFEIQNIGHCFIRYEDSILDITATQFAIANNPLFDFSKIEIIKLKERDSKHYFWEITHEFDNSMELKKYQEKNDWPMKSIATAKKMKM